MIIYYVLRFSSLIEYVFCCEKVDATQLKSKYKDRSNYCARKTNVDGHRFVKIFVYVFNSGYYYI